MSSSAADAIEKPQITRLKILVVDDDDLNRRMMRLLLMRDGHDVQLVGDGMEALEAVKDQKFDVVFMDLQMPVMDGIEASRRIREWENGDAHTYIVALTASFLPEQGHLLFEAGIDNYISKPFEVDHIQRLLGLIARNEHITPAQTPSLLEGIAANGNVLDIRKGTIRVGGDLQMYKELLSDFVQELPGRISTLEKFALEQDMISLARAAHNLKGVSSNLGALQVADCASKLDKPSNEGYTDHHQALILDLKRAESNLQKIAANFLAKNERTVTTA